MSPTIVVVVPGKWLIYPENIGCLIYSARLMPCIKLWLLYMRLYSSRCRLSLPTVKTYTGTYHSTMEPSQWFSWLATWKTNGEVGADRHRDIKPRAQRLSVCCEVSQTSGTPQVFRYLVILGSPKLTSTVTSTDKKNSQSRVWQEVA